MIWAFWTSMRSARFSVAPPPTGTVSTTPDNTAQRLDAPMLSTLDAELAAAEAEPITSIAQLEAIVGEVRQTSIDKESAAMTPLEQECVRASPFYLLATASADGMCDVSPR